MHMRLALLTSFAASKKDPLAQVTEKIHKAFLDAGLGEPNIRFNFGDAPTAGFVSSINRVLKRFPELERFVTSAPLLPHPLMQNMPSPRRIAGSGLPISTLLAIAAGVPRSFPFHNVAFHFHSAEFGELTAELPAPESIAGILVTDSWWVNGRMRSMSACTFVDADSSSKKLPPLPSSVATVLAACGKVKKTMQAPLPGTIGPGPTPGVRLPSGHMIPSVNPEAAQKAREVTLQYRARLAEIAGRVMPHHLPDSIAAHKEFGLEVTAGPKKPALEAVFKPMGYSIRGDSGSFTLRRRTQANLTAELHLDVGTWSHSVANFFAVYGVGYKAVLLLPVSPGAVSGGQYPIGDAARWQKIAENFGAIVAELDHTFIPDLESAAGPAPEWYHPEA
jgi:hypothetical protein